MNSVAKATNFYTGFTGQWQQAHLADPERIDAGLLQGPILEPTTDPKSLPSPSCHATFPSLQSCSTQASHADSFDQKSRTCSPIDDASIMYTSGLLGPPKSVSLPHSRAIINRLDSWLLPKKSLKSVRHRAEISLQERSSTRSSSPQTCLYFHRQRRITPQFPLSFLYKRKVRDDVQMECGDALQLIEKESLSVLPWRPHYDLGA